MAMTSSWSSGNGRRCGVRFPIVRVRRQDREAEAIPPRAGASGKPRRVRRPPRDVRRSAPHSRRRRRGRAPQWRRRACCGPAREWRSIVIRRPPCAPAGGGSNSVVVEQIPSGRSTPPTPARPAEGIAAWPWADVATIPNIVAAPAVLPRPRRSAGGHTTLVTTGALRPLKNNRTAIHALRHLPDSYVLKLAGDSPLADPAVGRGPRTRPHRTRPVPGPDLRRRYVARRGQRARAPVPGRDVRVQPLRGRQRRGPGGRLRRRGDRRDRPRLCARGVGARADRGVPGRGDQPPVRGRDERRARPLRRRRNDLSPATVAERWSTVLEWRS